MNHQGYTGELLYGVRRKVNLTLGRGTTIPRYGMQPYYGMADNHTMVWLHPVRSKHTGSPVYIVMYSSIRKVFNFKVL